MQIGKKLNILWKCVDFAKVLSKKMEKSILICHFEIFSFQSFKLYNVKVEVGIKSLHFIETKSVSIYQKLLLFQIILFLFHFDIENIWKLLNFH